MKTLFTLVFFSTLSFALSETSFKDHAKDLIFGLKKTFMKELKTDLKNGAVKTVNTCHLKAPHLMEGDFNKNYEVGRSSHKIRNPKNSPQNWLKPILEEYQKSTAKNPMPAKTLLVDGKNAYVEPIYIKAVCLQCHGNIQGSLKNKISKVYPDDKATGFKLGEFRGVFWLIEK